MAAPATSSGTADSPGCSLFRPSGTHASPPCENQGLTSLPEHDKTLLPAWGGRVMSSIVHYECRNPDHIRAGSRRGIGGTVIHHGSVGYCDGVNVDGAHRWVPTGGVPIEYLYDGSPA